MPEQPLIYRNKYRERITMNSKLIQMDSLDMLDGETSYLTKNASKETFTSLLPCHPTIR